MTHTQLQLKILVTTTTREKETSSVVDEWVQKTGWNSEGRMQGRGIPQRALSGKREGETPYPFVFFPSFLFFSSFSFFNILLVIGAMGDMCVRACMHPSIRARMGAGGVGREILLPGNTHRGKRTALELVLSALSINGIWGLNLSCQLFMTNTEPSQGPSILV